MKTGKQIKRRRKFSEEFKRSRVREFERGKLTVLQISREYDIHENVLYAWIRKYSIYEQKGYRLIVESKSLGSKNTELRKRIKDLEALLGRKQMEIEYLNKLIELTGDELGIDMKKKVDTSLLNGSATTKDNIGGQ